MLTSQNLNWIAGIVEGEGCVGIWRTPVLKVVMTDKDVMERLAGYFKVPLRVYDRSKENRKTQYVAQVYGSDAIGWMLTLYTLLGTRRRAKIEEIVQKWKECPGKGGWQRDYWNSKKEAASAKPAAKPASGK